MEAELNKFASRDTAILAIAVQDQSGAQATARETGVSYPILADPQHEIADAYGVFNLLNDGVAAPAVFVIDKNGQISWSYIGENLNDRPEIQLILDNLPPTA